METKPEVGDFYSFDEEYRDHLATVDARGNRIWIYPKKPKGTYHNYRIVVTVFLLGLLLSGPFIKVGASHFFCLMYSKENL